MGWFIPNITGLNADGFTKYTKYEFLFPATQNVRNFVTLPGMRSEHTLLNVVRSRGPGRVRDAVVIDNLEVKAKPGGAYADDPQDYYTAEDFRIGDTVALAGRDVLVYDCDAVTKNFYKQFIGRGFSHYQALF